MPVGVTPDGIEPVTIETTKRGVEITGTMSFLPSGSCALRAFAVGRMIIGTRITGARSVRTPIKGQSDHQDACFDESHTAAERKGQRREAAADDVRFVSERIGWLPFAAPSGSKVVA